jgi:hypothetical protein
MLHNLFLSLHENNIIISPKSCSKINQTLQTIADSGMGIMNTTAVTAYGNTIWAVSKDYSIVSKLSGSTWANCRVGNQPSDPPFSGCDIVRNPNSNIFAAGSNSNRATLYKSTNNGLTFSAIPVDSTSGIAPGNTFTGIVIDPMVNSDYWYVFGRGSRGNSYYQFYRNECNGPDSCWFAYNIVGNNNSNLVNTIAIDSASGGGDHSHTIFAGLDNGTIYKSTDAGSNWGQSPIASGLGCVNSLAINSWTKNYIYAATTIGLYRSTNYGVNWGQILTGSWRKVIMRPASENDGLHIAAVTSYGDTVQYSNDGGVSWISATNNVGTHVNNLRGVPADTAAVYTATDMGIYYIKRPNTPAQYDPSSPTYLNSTLAWTSQANAQNYHLYVADNADFESPRVNERALSGTSYRNWNLMVGTYYWKVAAANLAGESPYQSSPDEFTMQSRDQISLTLTNVNGQHPALSWSVDSTENPEYTIYRYACTYGGDDCGVEPYTPIARTYSTTYTDLNVTQLCKCSATTTYYYQVRAGGISNKVQVNTGQAGGGGGGEMDKNNASNIPKEMRLYENYPNPFNPITSIQYDLSKDGHVTLKIYDVLGREVAALVNGEKTAGAYTVQFDASKLSSGVYFSRMEAGKYIGTKKLLLLR